MTVEANTSEILKALAHLVSATFVVTSQHEGKRAGVICRSAQACAEEPALVCVSVRRGHWIEPIIRDAHTFAVCRINPSDRLMLRKFAESSRPRDGDPFDCIVVERLVTPSPIIARATLALDCEVVRHFDIEADHELYIGRVLAARIGGQGEAPVVETLFAPAAHATRAPDEPKPRPRGRQGR